MVPAESTTPVLEASTAASVEPVGKVEKKVEAAAVESLVLDVTVEETKDERELQDRHPRRRRRHRDQQQIEINNKSRRSSLLGAENLMLDRGHQDGSEESEQFIGIATTSNA